MGLFDSIGRAINQTKQRAILEAERAKNEMENEDLRTASYIFLKRWNSTSIFGKTAILQVYNRKVEENKNCNEIYECFCEMYSLIGRDVAASAASKILWEKLYTMKIFLL